MLKNPYQFIGPLAPERDKTICMAREKEKNKVIAGISSGEYWTIIGPSQVGKTTFLFQLMHELPVFHTLYINFSISPKEDEPFYKWIIQRIIDMIPSDSAAELAEKWQNFGPELNFFNFLYEFKPRENKKIVFFFDDMEKAHCVRSFLHLWRKVFHERYTQPDLGRYVVVTAGKVDLHALTIGITSPFNIAQKLELGNFTEIESRKLVEGPLHQHKIKFETEAKNKLIFQTAGHPQLLQHLCYILFEETVGKRKLITGKEIDGAISRLLIENDNLKTLEKEVKTNKVLESLLRQILKGENKDFTSYRDLSITGTGPIISEDGYCRIRNKIYEKIIKNVLNVSAVLKKEPKPTDVEYETIIYTDADSHEFSSIEEEKAFIKSLFSPDQTTIEIRKNNTPLKEIYFNRTEKLIFCYLAYINHEAAKDKKSPSMCNYHLSSIPRNNVRHGMVWTVFVDVMKETGTIYGNSSEPDATIRQAIYSIRKRLKILDAEDLIPRQKPGGGEGYRLKGKVSFKKYDK
jgi:hypothetical protein